jgi:Na+/phosphate symporter
MCGDELITPHDHLCRDLHASLIFMRCADVGLQLPTVVERWLVTKKIQKCDLRCLSLGAVFFFFLERPVRSALKMVMCILSEVIYQKLASLLLIEKLDFSSKLLCLFRKLAREFSYGACTCATVVTLESWISLQISTRVNLYSPLGRRMVYQG